jgi:hypothetical protein
VNGDGRADVATGWEEGGTIRACLHPGEVDGGEKFDLVELIDLDGDGIWM